MLKGKKKLLAAQVLLGLMVAGNAYAADVTNDEAGSDNSAKYEFKIGNHEADDGGSYKENDTKYEYGNWGQPGENEVLVGNGGKFLKDKAADADISGVTLTIETGSGKAIAIKGKKITKNIINIGNQYYYLNTHYLTRDGSIFDGDSYDNEVNLAHAKLADGGGVNAGAKNTLNVGLLVAEESGVPNQYLLKAGTINVNDVVYFADGNTGTKDVVDAQNFLVIDASGAGDKAVININADNVTAKSINAGSGLVEIKGKGVKAKSTLAKVLKISADGFNSDDYDALNVDINSDGDYVADGNKANKIIINGNDVDFTMRDSTMRDFWKSIDVNGDNFKVGNIHSYKDNDVMSVAGNNATMGNITFNGKSSTLNVSGNGAVLGNVSGSGASSVNISGDNVKVGDITTATSASSGDEIIISGNNTTTGALDTGSLKITGNGTLENGDVSNVGKIIIQSTATGDVFKGTGMSEGKLDVDKSKTNKTTALFSNDYAASYDADTGRIKNTRTQSIREQSKSYVETQMAALAMVASGADLLANAGFTNAAQAVQDAKDSGDSGRSMVPYAAANYGSMRQESGSHVDVKGSNFNIGFAKEVKNGSGKLLFGPMFEYGRGNYDSYLDDGTTGSGTAQNYGIGMMARQTNDNGFYYEGSVRYGKVTSDYSSSNVLAGKDVSYDNSAKYWGAHVGVGKLQKLGGDNAIDLYGKLFYTNQGSSSVNIDGDTLDFSSVKSKRSRIGFRYIHGTSDVRSVYAGLAWQYEFDGAAHATANGFSTPSPSVKGSSGMLELGVLIAPKASPVSFDLGVSGWAGKQKGYSLNANMLWSF